MGKGPAHVRFGSEADIRSATRHVCFAPNSDRESGFPQTVGATTNVGYGPKADSAIHSSGRFHLLDDFVGAADQ
jgi:hypothetical protein